MIECCLLVECYLQDSTNYYHLYLDVRSTMASSVSVGSCCYQAPWIGFTGNSICFKVFNILSFHFRGLWKHQFSTFEEKHENEKKNKK